MGQFISRIINAMGFGPKAITSTRNKSRNKLQKTAPVNVFTSNPTELRCVENLNPVSSEDEEMMAESPLYEQWLFMSRHDPSVGNNKKFGKRYESVLISSIDGEHKFCLSRLGANIVRYMPHGHPEAHFSVIQHWPSDPNELLLKPPCAQFLQILELTGERTVQKIKARPVYHFQFEGDEQIIGDICSWRYVEDGTAYWTNSKLLFDNEFCRDCDEADNRLFYFEVNNEE